MCAEVSVFPYVIIITKSSIILSNLCQISEQHVGVVVTTRQIVVRGAATTIPLKISDARENRHAMVTSNRHAFMIDNFAVVL